MGEFNTLRSTNAEDLVYVKEDLIIPHHYSFYDLIITKARGKSGPLFQFDVHDDVRLVNDATIEKDESHPGKVMLHSTMLFQLHRKFYLQCTKS
jgi:protein FAM50